MNGASTSAYLRLRRANPFVMLAVGLLVGSLLTAIVQDPGSGTADVATRPGGSLNGGALRGGDLGAGDEVAGPRGTGPVSSAGPATAGGGGGGAPISGAASPSGGEQAGPGTAAAGAAECTGAAATGERGVTDDAVKVGFAIPNIDAFIPVFGEQVDPGDMQAHIEAILDGMRRDGRLPVCGRDIDPVFREYIVPNEASSRSVCTGFIDEDKVFAVVALFAFDAQDCVAIEKQTPLFDLFATEENLALTPYLFGMSAPPEVAWRSVAYWLVETGVVNDKKIGVYHSTETDVVPKNLIATLERLGHAVDVIVTTDTPAGSTAADPNDGVAVQRFKAERVTLAIPAAGGGNFYRQAESQDYHPQWAVQGVALASDATTGDYPPEIFDEALALLFEHVGEEKAGFPMTPEEAVCYRYWEEAGGKIPPRDWGEGQTIRESCDQINLFTRAIAGVGNNPLTRDTFVLGVETIRDVRLAYYGDAVVAPDKHYVTSKNVQQRYLKDCACWHSSNNWVPLYAR